MRMQRPFFLRNRAFGWSFSRRVFIDPNEQGITLVEVLMAMLVLSIVAIASISTFNFAGSAIYKTEKQAKYNSIIDNDISRIRQIAQAYNACSSPTGSTSTSGCGAYGEANSYYYFPDPSIPANVASFEAACQGSSSHITANFITAIGSVALGSPVSRQVQRENSTNSENHNVVVTYSAPGGIARSIVLSPYLSFWCS